MTWKKKASYSFPSSEEFFPLFDYMDLRIYSIQPLDCDRGETEGSILLGERHLGIPGSNHQAVLGRSVCVFSTKYIWRDKTHPADWEFGIPVPQALCSRGGVTCGEGSAGALPGC